MLFQIQQQLQNSDSFLRDDNDDVLAAPNQVLQIYTDFLWVLTDSPPISGNKILTSSMAEIAGKSYHDKFVPHSELMAGPQLNITSDPLEILSNAGSCARDPVIATSKVVAETLTQSMTVDQILEVGPNSSERIRHYVGSHPFVTLSLMS